MNLADRKLIPGMALVLALIVPLSGLPARAEIPAPSSQETADTQKSELTPEEAREARIQKQLQKSEEKRAAKEKKKLDREAERQLEQTREAQEKAEEEAHKAAVAAGEVASTDSQKDPALPKRLAAIQDDIRASRLGRDPTVVRYLDLVESQQASAQQLAAFGSFIAEAGARKAAVEYYAAAIKLDKEDPLIWLNLGTLHRQLGAKGDAVSAYERAVGLENTNAVAHYNLGATYDSQGKYKNALEEYRIALTLDPDLADPKINPQAANNERLLAVKLMLYQETIGGLGIPLVEIPAGRIDDEE